MHLIIKITSSVAAERPFRESQDDQDIYSLFKKEVITFRLLFDIQALVQSSLPPSHDQSHRLWSYISMPSHVPQLTSDYCRSLDVQ